MNSSPNAARGTKRERTRDDLLVSTQILLQEYNVAALRIRQITDHAGLVHASFYNYYPDVSALIHDLGELLGVTHAVTMAQLVSADDSPSKRFAMITRATMRIVAEEPFLGRLMFDVGLPILRLGGYLRQSLRFDIEQGVARGDFDVNDIETAVSLMSGAIHGVALDVHLGVFPSAKIDTATERLLIGLGVEAAEAARLAFAPLTSLPSTDLPMRWLALPHHAFGSES